MSTVTVTRSATVPAGASTMKVHLRGAVETATVDFTSPAGASCTVKLYRGIPPRELSDVLLAAFPSELRNATIVAFLQEHGDDLIPLRAACKNPFLLGASVAIITEDALADGLQDEDEEEEEEEFDSGIAAAAAAAAAAPAPASSYAAARNVTEVAIRFRGEERRVGLSAGLSVHELTRLLWAVFPPTRGHRIAGFRQSADHAPFLYPEEVCNNPALISSPPLTLHMAPLGTDGADEGDDDDDDDEDDDEEEEDEAYDVDFPDDDVLFPRISDEEARAIREIINKDDPRVRKAFQAFPDLQLLVNAFMRLARFSVAWSNQEEARQQQEWRTASQDAVAAASAAADEDEDDEDEEDGSRAMLAGMTLERVASDLGIDLKDPQGNARTIVGLRNEGLLQEDAAVILLLMLVQENPVVFGAHVAYDVTQDKEDLVDSLTRIAAKVKRGMLARQQQADAQEEEDEDEEDDDENSAEHVYGPFLTGLRELHERGQLTTSEVNALEALLLTDDDELVIQCFLGHDPTRHPSERLVENLLAVLRQRADELLAEDDALAGHGDDDDKNEDDDDGGESSESQPPPAVTSSDEDDDGKAAGDEDEEEEEEEDSWKERLGLDEDVLVDLLNQLTRDSNMSASEMTDFLHLLREGHELVLGAYDAYVADRDVEEFTDTLQRILHHQKTMKNAQKQEEEAEMKGREATAAQDEEDEDEEALGAAVGANAAGDDDTSEELQCISVLHSNKLLTDEEAEHLWELILDHDPTIMAAFDAFAHTGRWETLRDSLDTILERWHFFSANRRLFDQTLADLIEEERVSLKVSELLQVAWENKLELLQAVFESEDAADPEALKEDLQVLGQHLAEQENAHLRQSDRRHSGGGGGDGDDDDDSSDDSASD